MPKCRCGCEGEAEYVVTGFDFDPKMPGGKGKAFSEPCCHTAACYLEESSSDFNLPCVKVPVNAATRNKTSGQPPTTMI